MVRVRLSRGGGKKRPYYHIIVVDQKSRRDGKCIERMEAMIKSRTEKGLP